MALSFHVEKWLLRFAIGAAALSLAVFVLCAIGWATPITLALAAIVVTAGVSRIRFEATAGVWPAWWWALIAAPFAVLYVVNAAAPEISPDGAGYHLGLVRQYLDHHGFFHLTTNFYANFPQAAEMIFEVAYALGGHSAAALVHLSFLFVLAAAMITYGRRFGVPAAGAAVLVFVTPVVGADASSAYVDVALAFAGFMAFYCLESQWLTAAGLLAGFAFGVKYTGVTVFLFALGYVVARGGRWRQVWEISLPAALMALPWLVKNWIIVANPLSPFFNGLFPNPYIDASFEAEYREAMRHFGGVHLGWDTPLELTVRGGLLQGALGPVWLLAPIALLAWRDMRGRRLLLAGAVVAAPWLFNIGTRFLIPALPFFALAMMIALARWPKAMVATVLLQAVLVWPQVFALYGSPYAWRLTRFPWKAALRMEPEREWIAANAPDVRFAWMLQEHAPADAVIYTAQPIMTSYTDRTILLNYTSALNLRVEALLKAVVDPKFRPTIKRTLRFSKVVEKIEARGEGEAVFVESSGTLQGWAMLRTLDAGADHIVIYSRSNRPLRLFADGRPVNFQESTEPAGELPDLRQAAIDEVRRLGVTHLAIHDLELLGPDIQKDPARWQLKPIAAEPPLRLYEITSSRPPSRVE